MAKSVFDGAYPSLLQGVSEQPPAVRLAGHHTSQINMLSDPQTGLRRRPGAKYLHSFTDNNNPLAKLVATEAVVGGQQVNVFVNSGSGQVWVKSLAGAALADLSSSYLIAADRKSIRFAGTASELFILNTERKPVKEYEVGGGVNPYTRGFFFVASGAFHKKFDVRVRVGLVDYVGTFQTPDGTGLTDAVAAGAQNIAEQLRASLVTAGLTVPAEIFIKGAYVFIRGYNPLLPITVASDSGSVYVSTSSQSYVRQTTALPADMPNEADGYICKVGDSKYPVYYKWANSTQQWVESSMASDVIGLSNMPVAVVYSGSSWSIDSSQYEGRYAGDEDTNPAHGFVDNGITGISSHQGRLVLLSRSNVSFSASNRPRRFWRSTVTSLLDADAIEAGSSQLSNAVFEYAVPFNKDLLVFSEKAQAVVPTGNSVLTPRNAAVVPVTNYAMDMSSSPVATGRTIMYCIPRSPGAYGVMELVPSSTTDSQYTSLDSTAHIPTFLRGRCRFSMASPVARMVLFASSDETNVLYVHEHLWDTDSKQQAAWHKWVFPVPVAYAFFTNNTITVTFAVGPGVTVCTIDPRLQYSERVPFIDLYTSVALTPLEHTSQGYLPSWLVSMVGDTSELRMAVDTGDLKGQELSAEYSGVLITVNDPVSSAYIGLHYSSSFTPTEPILKDYKDKSIMGGRLSTLRLFLMTNDTAGFSISVATQDSTYEYPLNAVMWHSSELELGVAPVSSDSSLIVPIRSDSRNTDVTLECSEITELNITGIDYTLQYMAKLKRR